MSYDAKASAETWAARICGEDEHLASTAECVCAHGYFFGECFDCCKAQLECALASAYRAGAEEARDWRRLSELQDNLLVAYRTGRAPSGKVLDEMHAIRERLAPAPPPTPRDAP